MSWPVEGLIYILFVVAFKLILIILSMSSLPMGVFTFKSRPDDLHYHFRDGVALKDTVPAVSRLFARAIASRFKFIP